MIKKLFQRSRDTTPDDVEVKSDTAGDLSQLIQDQINAIGGVRVDSTSAMKISAVYACVRLISSSVAMMPTRVKKYTDDIGNTMIDRRHPAHKMFTRCPYQSMTPTQWKRMMTSIAVLRGDSTAFVTRNMRDQVVAMQPLPYGAAQKVVKGGKIDHWKVSLENQSAVAISTEQMLHYMPFTMDGVNPVTPIDQARKSMSVSLAQEQHSLNTFERGANPSVIFVHPGTVSPEAHARLKEQLKTKYQGLSNSGRPMLLDEGFDVKTVSMSNQDAQFLESRRFQLEDIARWYGVQPHMIQDLSRSTNNNIEEQSREFVSYTLMPYTVCWEETLNLTLFGDDLDRFIDFNEKALIRGDTRARAEYLKSAVGVPWLSVDDARLEEGYNTAKGGSELQSPLNFTAITEKQKQQSLGQKSNETAEKT